MPPRLKNSAHELMLPTATGQGSLVHQKARILELPLDIWDEISSHFPTPVPYRRPTLLSPTPAPCALDHVDILKALSQTCRCLRAMYLRRFWEQFEACSVRLWNETEPNSPNQGSPPFNWKNYPAFPTSVAEFDHTFSDLEVEPPCVDFSTLSLHETWACDLTRFARAKSNWLMKSPEYAAQVQ